MSWVKCLSLNARHADIYKSVYSALFPDDLKPGKFQIGVMTETTVDALCGYDL